MLNINICNFFVRLSALVLIQSFAIQIPRVKHGYVKPGFEKFIQMTAYGKILIFTPSKYGSNTDASW